MAQKISKVITALFSRTSRRKNENLVTVFMPIYNEEKHLVRALESVLAQRTNFGYIIDIIDDGSTDQSMLLAEEYARRFPQKINIVKCPHRGLFETTIAGYERIKTKYWTVLDGDDFWLGRHKMQRAIEFLELHADFTLYGSNTFIERYDNDGRMSRSKYQDSPNCCFDFYSIIQTHTSSTFFRNMFTPQIISSIRRSVGTQNEDLFWGDTFRNYFALSKGMGYFKNKVDGVYCVTKDGIWTRLDELNQDMTHIRLYYEFYLYFGKYDAFFLLDTSLKYISKLLDASNEKNIPQTLMAEILDIKKKCLEFRQKHNGPVENDGDTVSRILISFYQPQIGLKKENLIHFYESLATELLDFGNEVMLLKTPFFDGFGKTSASWNEETAQKVKSFRPDLILTFNNMLPESVIKLTECPILLFNSDSSHFFVHKEYISAYKERYFMVSQYPGFEDEYKHLGLPKKKIFHIHLATSVKNEQCEKDKPISFIGSKFQMVSAPLFNYDKKELYAKMRNFWNTEEQTDTTFFAELNTIYDLTHIYNAILDTRNYVLSSVLDLGLSLYGWGWDTPTDNFALAAAFDPTPKFSLKHNQDIYNSSKICLSISHPQCHGYAYPWRTYDIMASNGLLVASYSKLLEEQTRGKVSIPMYKSPYDARDICKKYLAEPHLCEDIIAASNAYIEKHGRWKDNFQTIQQITGVTLIQEVTSKDDCCSSIVLLDAPDSCNSPAQPPEETPKKGLRKIWYKIKKMGRFKLFLLFLFAAFVFFEATIFALMAWRTFWLNM